MSDDVGRVALDDQVSAADAEAARPLTDIAVGLAARGVPVLPIGTRRFHRRLNHKLRDALLAAKRNGERTACDHLIASKPQVVHWLGSGPSQWRCTGCAVAWSAERAGSPTCNLCTRPAEHFGAYRLKSVILERGKGRPPIAPGSIVIHWTLCGGCLGD